MEEKSPFEIFLSTLYILYFTAEILPLRPVAANKRFLYIMSSNTYLGCIKGKLISCDS